MVKKTCTIFLILINTICYSQSEITKIFYSDKNATEETKNEKGKYVMTVQTINDSIIQKKFFKSKTNLPIWVKEYLNNEPYGQWIFYTESGEIDYKFDYQFILEYGENIPAGFLTVDLKNKKLEQQTSGEFIMPYLDNPNNGIQRYFVQKMRYPTEAFINGIQGTVNIQLTIDKNGKIDNIRVLKGVHEALDRETFRLIHSMPNWTPAK